MLRAGFAILLLLPVFAVLPSAHACDAGTWVDGPQSRMEVVGVGANAVGIYTRERTWQEAPSSSGCEGQTWAHRCGGVGRQTTVSAVVPEIRVLGQTVVPETQVLPPTTVPWGIPSTNGYTSANCVTPPVHAGVYSVGIVNLEAGTDTLPLP